MNPRPRRPSRRIAVVLILLGALGIYLAALDPSCQSNGRSRIPWPEHPATKP